MALAAALSVWDDVPSTSVAGAMRYETLSRTTQLAHDFLYPVDISGATSSSLDRPAETAEQAAAIRYIIQQSQGAGELFKDFLDMLHARFFLVRRDIARYMGRFQETEALSKVVQTDEVMKEMLERLALWQRAWGMPLKKLNDNKYINSYISTFQSLLHASLPPKFLDYLTTFLSSSLASISPSTSDLPTQSHSELLQSVPMPRRKISPPSPHLARLAIFLRYSSTFMNVALAEIERVAKEEAEKGWDVRCLSRARQRVGDGVVNWLAGMLEGQGHGMEAIQMAMRSMFSRFDYYLCKCLFEIRTDELFSIIVDYPDSISALEDLRVSQIQSQANGKECLFKVDLRSQLVEKLQAANLKRLLHPGADTKDVLAQYISTIRCLRILDPPGVLLHKVAGPIRAHLRDRSDTIKHIVAALVDGEELQDENEAGGLLRESNGDVEDFSDPKWEPEPVDAAPGKSGDIVSTLVSIYETREVIIKELQILLAQRLLAVKDYEGVKEIRIIELLKLRFGEQALQVCDVMLKDMADSKRIDDRIQGDIKTSVHPLIISNRFWPEIHTSSLRLPPRLQKLQQDYETAFNQFKPDKHLRWMQHLGTARLRLEMGDRVIEAEADPIQAAIAELLEDQPEWTVSELSDKLDLPEKMVRGGLVFWTGFGLVKEDQGKWRVLEREE